MAQSPYRYSREPGSTGAGNYWNFAGESISSFPGILMKQDKLNLKSGHPGMIPLSMKTVQGYATHEGNLFDAITILRSLEMAADIVSETNAAEVELSKALGNLFIVSGNYPGLKVHKIFLELQRETSQGENDLLHAGCYFNGMACNFNILIEQFPSNLIVKSAGHRECEFFDIRNESNGQLL